MKKEILIFVFLCFPLLAWAQDTEAETETQTKRQGSAGFGAVFFNDFSGKIDDENKISTGIGAYLYGDFVFIELICGLFYGNSGKLDYLGAVLGVYGKYPFMLSKRFSIFPLLGFDYKTALHAKYNRMAFQESDIDWHQFWFKAGAGMDFNVGKKFHLRLEGLYGIRLNTDGENTLEDGTVINIHDSIGHGFTLRFAIGI